MQDPFVIHLFLDHVGIILLVTVVLMVMFPPRRDPDLPPDAPPGYFHKTPTTIRDIIARNPVGVAFNCLLISVLVIDPAGAFFFPGHPLLVGIPLAVLVCWLILFLGAKGWMVDDDE